MIDYFEKELGNCDLSLSECSILAAKINKIDIRAIPKNFNEIIRLLCDKYSVTIKLLKSKSKEGEIVKVRFMAWYFGRRYYPILSTTQLGLRFERNHASVINGYKRIGNWIKYDKYFCYEINQVNEIINQTATTITPKNWNCDENNLNLLKWKC